MLREAKIPILILSTICCAVFGALLARSLSRHAAEVTMAVDPLSYRSAQAILESEAELRKFAAAKGLLDSVEFQKLESQLRNRGMAVGFDLESRVKKRDLRDVPDSMLSGKKGQSAILDAMASEGLILEARVSASSHDAGSAARMVQFAMDYLRHSLYVNALRECLYSWGPTGRVEQARITERLVQKETELQGIEQRLKSITALRGQYKESGDVAAVAGSVQVQVQNAKNLSPFQQAIGLEVDRIEAEAVAKNFRLKSISTGVLLNIADEFLPKLEAGEMPAEVTSQIRKKLGSLPNNDDPFTKLAHDNARAAAEVALTGVEARWASSKNQAEQPLVRTTGFSRTIGALLGAMLGVLIWLGVLFKRRMVTAIDKVLAENT